MKLSKIIFYTNSLAKGGAQRVILNLAESLCDRNIEVILVTTKYENDEYPLSNKIKRVISDVEEQSLTNCRVSNFVKRVLKLRKIWMGENADVIISFVGKNNLMVILSSFFLKNKVLVSVRGEPRMEYYNKLMTFLAKTLFVFADGIILQTEEAKKFFPKWLQKKEVILPNALNPVFLMDSISESKKNEIISVGRLDENKNQKLLIDAFVKIAEDFKETNLILYGEGESKKYLLEYIEKIGYCERIHLPGGIEDVVSAMRRAKIFVLPSNTEGMPNALLEAMALGMAVISTDCPCGGPREFIQNGVNGILIPVGGVDELAGALSKLLSQEELQVEMGRNAFKIRERLSPDKTVNEWIHYIDKIMK